MEKNAARKQEELEENLQGLHIPIILFHVGLFSYVYILVFLRLVTASSYLLGQKWIGASGHQHKGPHL